MIDEITLTGPTNYNPRFAPSGAKKGYVARITGRASGAVKYEREFLGSEATLLAGDEGLYERQIGEKKGGYTRYYHMLLSHPEHGLILSADCEAEVPKIAKLLDDGVEIQGAVEVIDLRPSERHEGRMIFTARARTKSQAKQARAAASIDGAVTDCIAVLRGLSVAEQKKAISEIRKRLSQS